MYNRHIWRTAHLLVRRHGPDAESVAARHLEESMAEEHRARTAMWKLIMEAVEQLQSSTSLTRRQ